MTKKIVTLSLCTASFLIAAEVDLGKVEVTANGVTSKVENISNEELKSADLAEALSKNSASVSLIRRSGIANDIIVRGQKKDNIAVDIDGCCIAGACPNRMDPPTSHIVTNNVENVEIIGGPFDVESFGALSAKVKVKTKQPKEGLNGEVNLNAGSFGYTKAAASVSGGNSTVRVLVSGSTENGEQYEDGDGNTLAQQLENKLLSTATTADDKPMYKNTNKDMDAFTKKTATAKIFVNPTDNSELRFGYMANRSDDILYPSSTMDANYDDSNVLSFGATVKNLSDISKELKIDTYKSDVQHLMSTEFRNSSTPTTITDAYVETEMSGVKIKNSFEAGLHKIDLGIDTSDRNWNGYKKTRTATTYMDQYFIPDVDTKNKALFGKMGVDLGGLNVEVGARYDSTNIKANQSAMSMTTTANKDKDYNALSGNILATYKTSESLKMFVGVGQASRVPDAKELYMTGGTKVATGDLEQTTNTEVDFGIDFNSDSFGLKAKVFHSSLKDYIYYKNMGDTAIDLTATNTTAADGKTDSKYVNTDAKIYGIELNGYKDFTDTLTLDFGLNYQKGTKDALSGQTDTDMADITPLKTNIALNYDDHIHKATIEMVARKSWKNYDSDNGEQALSGWAILNGKYNHTFTKNIDVTVGMDNILNKTYAVTNTYKDLTLAGTADGVMLINEAGRYTYLNLRYKF
jgi:iron complex outermembrane receptor protein